ncbi:MAG: hypothetical protein MJ237_07380 [bacterium]|nr:hypothetical protein [bacterium]
MPENQVTVKTLYDSDKYFKLGAGYGRSFNGYVDSASGTLFQFKDYKKLKDSDMKAEVHGQQFEMDIKSKNFWNGDLFNGNISYNHNVKLRGRINHYDSGIDKEKFKEGVCDDNVLARAYFNSNLTYKLLDNGMRSMDVNAYISPYLEEKITQNSTALSIGIEPGANISFNTGDFSVSIGADMRLYKTKNNPFKNVIEATAGIKYSF